MKIYKNNTTAREMNGVIANIFPFDFNDITIQAKEGRVELYGVPASFCPDWARRFAQAIIKAADIADGCD
jgi:hypothetical protein